MTASEPTARSRPAWCASASSASSRRQRRQRPAPTACHGCWRRSNRTAWRWPRSADWNATSIGLLDEHGTTLRDEPGIGPIAAATLVVEVGDPFRFASESKFARWCGTGAVALSSGEGSGTPIRHRLDYGGNRRINSVLYIASVTQQRAHRRRPHLHRPQDRRRQDPTRSPPSPQTTPRQPSHPTHVERRITTTRTLRATRRLTRERPSVIRRLRGALYRSWRSAASEPGAELQSFPHRALSGWRVSQSIVCARGQSLAGTARRCWDEVVTSSQWGGTDERQRTSIDTPGSTQRS